MATKVKRSEFATYIDTVPAGVETYKLLAVGIEAAEISYNPETSEEAWLDEDNKSTSLDSYAPTMAIDSKQISDDDALNFVDGLRKSFATLSDAETTIVNVDLYETPTGSEYPARQHNVNVQIDKFGGDAAETNQFGFTLNYMGDPVAGTFNPTTSAFTAT